MDPMPEPERPTERTQNARALSATGTGGDTQPWAGGSDKSAASREPAAVERIGRFEIRGVLGKGAFGLVYQAFDPGLRREVAIKVPYGSGMTPELLDRFLVEARAAATIHHPNVCPVYEVGTENGVPFIVMHFVPGKTLAAVMAERKKPFPTRDAAAVVRKLALGLAAAHAQRVIHRDLKPANVLFDDANREVLITDFGLARLAGEARMTADGDQLGTPAYMSPEQVRGEVDAVGPLSDVYALGVILYHLVTGVVPYRGGSPWETMGQVQMGEKKPPSAARPGIDRAVDALCLKAMAKNPEDRFASAKEFAAALSEYLRGAPAPAAERTSPKETSSSGPIPTLPSWVAQAWAETATDPVGRPAAHPHYPVPPEAVDDPVPEELPQRQPRPVAGRFPTRPVVVAACAVVLVVGVVVAIRAVSGGGSGKPDPTPAQPADPRGGGTGFGKVVGDPRGAAVKAGDVLAVSYATPPVEMRFRWIPPGTFKRGSDTAASDEKPVREITITKGFWMAETECTQAQWRALMTASPDPSNFKGPNRPVDSVSAKDADAFCNVLSTATGRRFRLPTEAEWEYACRAGTTTEYHFGDTVNTDLANFDGTYSTSRSPKGEYRRATTDAGYFPGNAWGLRDMHGNVWEWCEDGYDAEFYAKSGAYDPVCTTNQLLYRVLRGGAWYYDSGNSRSAYRYRFAPTTHVSSCGFRVCFRAD